ncbi:MAG: DUF4330 family protein, partial [Clostridiales bacterium]|nr:DUF4330 family protein [Clostridiales bacterium]
MAKNQGKTRFNIIDVIILIAIIAVVAALIWIAVLQNRPGVFETREVEYTVRISGVAAHIADNISEGDVIWNTDENIPIGTEIAVRSEKTKYYNTEKTVNASGRLTVQTSEYPDR